MNNNNNLNNFTKNLLNKLAVVNPAPQFDSTQYPEDYAKHLMRAKGRLFMPDLAFADDVAEWSDSQLEKAVTHWAYDLKANEAELYCDMADAYLADEGMDLPDGRRDWMQKNA